MLSVRQLYCVIGVAISSRHTFESFTLLDGCYNMAEAQQARDLELRTLIASVEGGFEDP